MCAKTNTWKYSDQDLISASCSTPLYTMLHNRGLGQTTAALVLCSDSNASKNFVLCCWTTVTVISLTARNSATFELSNFVMRLCKMDAYAAAKMTDPTPDPWQAAASSFSKATSRGADRN